MLKERVNSKKIKHLFIFALVISLCINMCFAQETDQPFDYTKTVWIINVMEGSGTVYGRPGPEDYNPRQGFIYIYEILNKYVYRLQDIHSLNSPNPLTVTHDLVLINDVAEQRLLIGDHWLSDERHIAILDEIDYHNLVQWLGAREKNKDYKENPPLDKMIRHFRENQSPDIESFNDYFKRNSTSSTAINISSSLAKSVSSLPSQRHISESSSSFIADQSGTSNSAASSDSAQVRLGVKHRTSINKNLVDKSSTNKTAESIVSDEKQMQVSASEESSGIPAWIIAVGLLLGLLLVGWWIKK